MKEEIDKLTGERWIILSKEEIRFGFLAQCIEILAEKEGCNYVEMLKRLENVNMTEGYILAHYDVLHTESMDNIISELSDLLLKRESEKCE
ncbi:MAG: DUF3791 domain-containing protein [Muribaculaceae bacterium]|nr:DUF3791 domain-containing protein [Muribaculaceae bacterium]